MSSSKFLYCLVFHMVLHSRITFFYFFDLQKLENGLIINQPIFHCDAKYLASGFGVGQCPRRQNLALGDTNMLVSWSQRKPLKPVEYRLRLVPTQNSGIGHVHFMFFVLISFALGSQREPSFQWNMGFSVPDVSTKPQSVLIQLIQEAPYCVNLVHLSISCLQPFSLKRKLTGFNMFKFRLRKSMLKSPKSISPFL